MSDPERTLADSYTAIAVRAQGLIKCDSCPKAFVTKGQYKYYYPCEPIPIGSCLSVSCSRHHKTHTRPYRCGRCNQGFALRCDLERHKSKHGSVEPKFYCTQNGCTFRGTLRRDNLLRHLRLAHKSGIGPKQKATKDTIQASYKESLTRQKWSVGNVDFLQAVQNGNVALVERLLLNGAGLFTKTDKGATALHVAVLNGHCDLVQRLLQLGSDINAQDDEGMVPLHHAARLGNAAITLLLLENGSQTSAQNAAGETALHIASKHGYQLVVRQLLKYGSQVGLYDRRGTTAIYHASVNGHQAIVDALLDAGADCDSISTDNDLKLDAIYRHRGIMERLLGENADVADYPALKGRTTLHTALERGHLAIVETLLDTEVDVNTTGPGGATLLQIASR